MANGMTIGMTGGVMPVESVETATITDNRIGTTNGSLNSGVLIVGSDLSASQLEEAPQEPTVEINGEEFKQNPVTKSFLNTENGKRYTTQTLYMFPEGNLVGTTGINSVLYSKQTNTKSTYQVDQTSKDSTQSRLIISNARRYSYPSPTAARTFSTETVVTVNFVNRYAYPTVK